MTNNNNNNSNYYEEEIEEKIILLIGEGPLVQTRLNPPLQYGELDDVRIALTKITFYNSFANIIEQKNNCLEITVPGKTPEAPAKVCHIKIPSGAYELDEVYAEILYQLRDKHSVKNPEKNFVLEPNLATLKSMITLRQDYKVNFKVQHSIANFLGFKVDSTLSSNTRFQSPNIVNINTTSSLLVMTNLTTPSYLNAKPVSYLFNAVLDVEPGYKYTTIPQNLTFLPVMNKSAISDIQIWLVDQDENPLDFRHETLEVELKLIAKKKTKKDKRK